MASSLKRVVLVVAAALSMVTATTVSSCPSSLNLAVASPHCRAHIQRLATTTTVAIGESFCADSLQLFHPLMPCTTQLDTNYYYYEDTSPFKGKLNCTFDMTAPLNMSNLNQSFIIDCVEIQDPSNLLWLWIVLGILALFTLYACFSDKIDACWSRSGYNRIL